MDKKTMSTGQLSELLQKERDAAAILKWGGSDIWNPTLAQYLEELMENRQITAPQLIVKSNLSKAFVYQILDGTRNGGRDAVIRIAFALKLSLEEAQRLLALSQNGALYPRNSRDAAIMVCLCAGMAMDEASLKLEEIGLDPLL